MSVCDDFIGEEQITRRPARATGRDPFASDLEPRIELGLVEDLLEGKNWTSPHQYSLVDWVIFLSDTEPDMSLFAIMAEQMAEDSDLPFPSILVGIAGNIFQSLRTFQNAPTAQEGFARIHEMRSAADQLSRLAAGRPLRPDGSENEEPPLAAQLGKRSVGLHPFLHDLLQEMDAPQRRQYPSEPEWDRALVEYSRRDRRLRLFFNLINEVVGRLTISDKRAAENVALDPRSRMKGAPGDAARDWLLIRLMWIWRDVLGQEIKVYLPRIGKRGVHPEPKAPDNSLLSFVCDVMAHLEPILPDQLSALEKKLGDLRHRVPDGNLLTT